MHTLRVLLLLAPLALSLLRDHRRWFWWGAPLGRTPEFHARRARRLVSRLAALGPTFVKLAQVFSARADLIPEPYLSELGKLTDQVPPVPWPAIEAELVAAYGAPVASIFERIDHTPVAAASLGQVHRALWQGRDVAVKVLRPGIERLVARDLRSARAVAIWAAARWPIPHVLGFLALVEEFSQRAGEELDLRLEAEYATEVRANFAENPRVLIPEVIHELSRQRVLVLEFIDGTRVDRLEPGSVNAQRLAGLVIEVYVQMMLVDALFHADPHAGNLMVARDGRLVLLDFGMMVRVSSRIRLALIRTVFASIRRDAPAVARGFDDLGLIAPGAERAQITRLTELLVEMADTRSTTKERMDRMLSERIMTSLYDFPVILPRDLVYFARTASLIEGIGTRYDPYFNAIEVGTPLVLRLRSRILKSLGEEATPCLEELAAVAGFAVGRAWRELRERVGPWVRGGLQLLPAITLAAGLWATAGAQAAPAPSATGPDALDVRVERAVREEALVGAVWSLVTPEETRVGAAGLRDVGTGARLSPETRVQVGSVAKTLVALGVLRLVTEGRVALDDPITRHLPDLPIRPFRDSAAVVRVRHLLDHTSGLVDARLWQVFTARATPDVPLRDALMRPGESFELRTAPGERFSYSNTGYLILALLIESVAGEPYEQWLAKELLQPLGMDRSTFEFVTQAGEQADTTLAMGHYDPRSPHASRPVFVRPSMQFTTTASDMARVARFLLGDGTAEGRLLVAPHLLAAMAHPQGTAAARAGLNAGYALGLVRRDRYGAVGECHLGNTGTFRALFCVFPASASAVFVAFNSDPESGNFGRVDSLLVDALRLPRLASQDRAAPGVDPTDWAGVYRPYPVRFEQFRYLDDLFGLVRVRWDGSELALRPLQGSARVLTPVGGALFRAEGRVEASHVLVQTPAGTRAVSDGTRTWERVGGWRIALLWTSFAAGVAAFLYVLVVGAVRTVRAMRAHTWRGEPLRFPVLVVILLLLAPLLLLAEPSGSLGDRSAATLAIAAFSGALPAAIAAALLALTRRGIRSRRDRADLVALAALLQWCGVLFAWDLLPLALWR